MRCLKSIFFIFLIFTTGSCYLGGAGGGLASGVRVIIFPYGKGNVVQPRSPRLNYSPEGKQVPCRKQRPNLRLIRGIDQLEVVAELLLGNPEEGEGQEGNQRQNSDEPVNVGVEGGWIQFGLSIQNPNLGVGKNYPLVINRLEFYWNGNCRREGLAEDCVGSHTISSGYCGLPFIYLVPSGQQVDYKPLSENPLHNLVLYVPGFQILDSSALSKENNRLPGGASLIFPQYRVELILVGNFLLEDGTEIEPFVKRTEFYTTSRRAYK